MKKFLLIITLFILTNVKAQVREVTLQASGLTCSMCSKAIYKALEKMGTASKITSNIAESSYTMTFDSNTHVDFDIIRKVVENAGFSVAKMVVKADFAQTKIYNDAHIDLNGLTLHFLNVQEQTFSGEKTFTLVDKKFVTDKVYRKYAASTKMECVKTGVAHSCCPVQGKTGKRIYHVTV